VIKAYGVLRLPARNDQYPEWAGRVAQRSFFLVDRAGIVRGKWIGEDMSVFPSEEILKVARQLGAAR
jgi:peroxiredoxin